MGTFQWHIDKTGFKSYLSDHFLEGEWIHLYPGQVPSSLSLDSGHRASGQEKWPQCMPPVLTAVVGSSSRQLLRWLSIKNARVWRELCCEEPWAPVTLLCPFIPDFVKLCFKETDTKQKEDTLGQVAKWTSPSLALTSGNLYFSLFLQCWDPTLHIPGKCPTTGLQCPIFTFLEGNAIWWHIPH